MRKGAVLVLVGITMSSSLAAAQTCNAELLFEESCVNDCGCSPCICMVVNASSVAECCAAAKGFQFFTMQLDTGKCIMQAMMYGPPATPTACTNATAGRLPPKQPPAPPPPPPPPPTPPTPTPPAGCEDLRAKELAEHHYIGYTGNNITAGITFLKPSARNGAAVVCPLAEMEIDAGTVNIYPTTMLAIAGPLNALKPNALTPRLWARFVVNSTLLVIGVAIRDQSIAPTTGLPTGPSSSLGVAVQVNAGGRFVATNVSFINLTTTTYGGAVYVDTFGVAEFYGCLFSGCQATNGCDKSPNDGDGAAIGFGPFTTGIITDTVFQNNLAGCNGGALALWSENATELGMPEGWFVHITRSTFTNNFGGADGDFIYIWRFATDKDVPCPSISGVVAGPMNPGGPNWCFIYGDHENLTVSLPS